MVLLAVAITIIAILGGNAANLVCDPLHHPLERTDVLAVGVFDQKGGIRIKIPEKLANFNKFQLLLEKFHQF